MITRRAFHFALPALAPALALQACATPPTSSAVTAIDCHAHVFLRSLPMPDRRRAPSGYDAPLDAYLAQLDAHGMSHGVLVQPSFLGTDNRFLLQALAAQPRRLRGIAVLPPETPETELQDMDRQGVVGLRLNLVGLPTPDFQSTVWQRCLGHLRRLDWQVEVHREAALLQAVLDPLLDAGVRVVVDHFGRPDALLGVDDPGFRHLLELGSSRRVWVKLSGAYRNGLDGRGQEIALAAMPLLKDRFGLDRLVWGSD
ncbi:MAG: amidohydrolase family protein, partial [Curvibacter sp.]|nr:amidohydrolase family protein [Curvibacter sp.]